MGVPTLGCLCPVCTSADPYDRRSRPSVALRWTDPENGPERVVVIDTGPDFREQLLQAHIKHVDAVFYTHAHADHILGLDDLRPLSFQSSKRGDGHIPLYADEPTTDALTRVFDYTFSTHSTYPNKAHVTLNRLREHNDVHGVDFVRVPLIHGNMHISGYRFGNAAYLTDVSDIPETSFELLHGIDVLILSALRYEPHYSHATVGQALQWVERIGARKTWLTHIAHELGHAETNRKLPANVKLSYDGLSVPVTL